MTLRCCLDLDGVLADFYKGYAAASGVRNYIDWPLLGKHRCSEAWPNKNPWWSYTDSDFWRNLERTPDANQIIELVLNRFDIDDVCVCTSLSTSDKGDIPFPLGMVGEAVQGKIDWLQKNFPELMGHFLIGPSKHFCAGSDCLLIDDNDENIKMFQKKGGLTILVPRRWNSLYDLALKGDTINYILTGLLEGEVTHGSRSDVH